MIKAVQRHVPEQKSSSVHPAGSYQKLPQAAITTLIVRETMLGARTTCLAGHRLSETVSEPPFSVTVFAQRKSNFAQCVRVCILARCNINCWGLCC